MFCNPKCGVTNKMLYALSRKDTCRHLRGSFFAAVAHSFQPFILDVSVIPICISSYLVTVWMIWRNNVLLLLHFYCFQTSLLMVEWRHIECIINIDEINSFQTNVPFFTFLKTENRWLSNVSWGYRNITFSLNGLKVYIDIMFVLFSELLNVCS